MSETKDTDRPAGGSGRKPVTVNRTQSAGTVRQDFPRGRSKPVVVEKKRRRVVNPKDGAAGGKELTPLQKKARELGLSEEEFKARLEAARAAKAKESEREAQKFAEAEARQKREDADRQRLEEERRAVAEAKERAEQEAREKAEAEARAKAEAERAAAAPAQAEAKPAARRGRGAESDAKPRRNAAAPVEPAPDPATPLEELGGRVKRARGAPADGPNKNQPQNPKQPARTKGEPERRRRKLTISSALDDADGERQRSIAALKRAREKERQRRVSGGAEREKARREVVVPEAISVHDLANRMTERTADVIKYLMKQGQMLRANDLLDADTAELIVADFGHDVKRVSEADVEQGFLSEEDADEAKADRPPVVTVMGHVDHGKTSLLDALRATDMVSGEAGGITQHIGAYQVNLKSGERITFLDTPGHAAFSSMRARGANVTDIVILVVAADDGVMPQTIEAINHAKAAGVPIIVAVNKVDKPDAKPERVLQELLQYEIVVEAMGGEVQAVEVSALQKTGLDTLAEAVTLQSEVLELKANPDRSAEGAVIESQLDKGRGPVATVLVQRGTLKRGDLVVAGSAWGRVRALVDERGRQLKEAGPSTPVEILGLSEPPDPGEVFAVVESEARAREITEYRERARRRTTAAGPSAAASLEQMMAKLKDKTVSEMPVVVKADVQGSAEAIAQSLEKLGNEEVRARVIHQAVGGVNESDILLARASDAPVIAFNVRANKQARDLAEQENIEIRYYSIIYQLMDDVKAVLEGMLAPEKRENFLGYAEILQVFNISKVGKVAGCRITEGVVKRGCGVRLLRDDVVIHEGKLSTLKRFKDEVPEVSTGMECGMAFEKYQDIQESDVIECFEVIEIERKLD